MSPQEKARKEIEKHVFIWRDRLLLNEWAIDIELAERDLEDHDGRGECLADISADPVYLKARLRVFPCWSLRSKAKREEAILHELCHCLTQAARDLLKQAREGETVHHHQMRDTIELLTQRICNAVQWRSR